MAAQQFSLRWNNYTNYITGAFDSLRYEEDLVDVTLCCEGRKIRAHKILLSACSAYFKEIFKENPCQHPVIIFKNVKYSDLMSIVEFMYQGEVSVVQESLPSFLHTAELLSIRGLTDNSGDTRQQQTQQATSSLAQQIIQTQNQSLLDKATITTAESVYLTLPSNSTIVHQPAKLLQAQIATAPQILNKTIIKTAPAEMPTLTTASGATITVPISQPQQQQQTIAKIQVQAPQQTTTIQHQQPQQQTQVVQAQTQHVVQQQTVQQQQQQQTVQQTQATTLQEVVESVVSQPKKKKIKVQQIIHTSTPNQSVVGTSGAGTTTTVVTTQVAQAPTTADTEIFETPTETYHISTSKADEDQRAAQEAQEQVESYAESAQTAGSSMKMEIPEYIDCSEGINTSNANNTTYIQEESYELVAENMDDKDVDEEDMNQDGIEMETSDMDMNRIFQGASDETKASLLQGSGSEAKQFHTCSECHRQFCSMNAMKRHKLAKHGDNKVSYSCLMCNAIFKTKWSLSTHKSKYHRDKVMVIPVKSEPEVTSPAQQQQQQQPQSQPVATSTPVAITVRKLGGQPTAITARKGSAVTTVIP